MITIPIPGPATVDAEALLRLELLLGERVVALSAISDIVSQDSGLKIHILHLAHDTLSNDSDEVSLDECIVETGIERLRESLRQTRFRLKAN
jgi:hypothetical protein